MNKLGLRISLILSLLAMVSMTTKADDLDYLNWMSKLPDNMFVTNLSIPGTHDSGTKGFSWNAATQDKTIAEQLQCGVRAFDMRPGVYSSSALRIYHSSSTHGDESFSSIMTTLTTFLNEHPTECIIMLTKKEYDKDSQWAGLMKSTLEPFKSYFVDFVPYITLGQMRGKILILNRDSYDADINKVNQDGAWTDNATFEMGWRGNNNDYISTKIQDIYDASDKIDQKKSDIETLMSECMQGNTHKLYINHTSGYTSTYVLDNRKLADCAEKCNEVAINYLNAHSGPVGMIMMDFAGVDKVSYVGSSCDTRGQILIDAIINNSYKTAENMQPDAGWVAPKGKDFPWTAKYYNKTAQEASSASLDALDPPADNWYAKDFDDSAWSSQYFPAGNVNCGGVYCSRWTGEYNTLWIRREFNLDKSPAKYTFHVFHDDDYVVYINGHQIDAQDGWSTDWTYREVEIPQSYLVNGKNVIAVQVQQNWGGAYFDCGIYKDESVEEMKLAISASCNDGEKAYTTYSSSKAFVVPGELTVSTIAVDDDGVLTVTPYATGEVVPANTGVMISATKDYSGSKEFSFYTSYEDGTTHSGNCLKPTGDAAITADDMAAASPDCTYYRLTMHNGEQIGFWWGSDNGAAFRLSKNKAYLALPKSIASDAKMSLWFGDNVSGINETPTLSQGDGAIYNLAGQRVSPTTKGILIKNGKKYILFRPNER